MAAGLNLHLRVALWHTARGTQTTERMTDKKRLFRVSFLNQGKIYEVYARRVSDAGMLGFVQIEDLVFGERSGVVVDPSEERLRDEFSGVEKTYIPMHSVIRIDQVTRHGASKISDADGANVTPFPLSMYAPKSTEPGGSKR